MVQADDLGKSCTSIDVNNTGLPVLLKGFGVSNAAASQLALTLDRYETAPTTGPTTSPSWATYAPTTKSPTSASPTSASPTNSSPSGAGGRRLASAIGGGVVRVAVYTCPGGEVACPNNGVDGMPLCAEPYAGPMCSQCSVGY